MRRVGSNSSRPLLARTFVPLTIAILLMAITAPSGQAAPGADPLTPPDWVGRALLVNADVVAMSNPASTQEELPGLGHKFELIGAMVDDKDPNNETNDTISDVMTTTNFALAYRDLPPGIKIAALRDQLNLKYYFVFPRSCGGGSPRITLLVDANGDGQFNQIPNGPDFAAHGHVMPPSTVGCPSGRWGIEDLTDEGNRWEVTPGGAVTGLPAFPYATWNQLEAAISTQFGNHKILAGFLVDDSCSFFPASCGTAYYDLLTIENRTLENDQDTVKKGS